MLFKELSDILASKLFIPHLCYRENEHIQFKYKLVVAQ